MNKEELASMLQKKGFPDSIVEAFTKVQRAEFVPEHLVAYAYEDNALPIQEGQTLSQPSTLAFMLELLEPKENQKILEIGSGSGFVLALLSALIKTGTVIGVELKTKLATQAKERLAKDHNIRIFNLNGLNGMPQQAPFDRIIISASCPDIATVYKIIDQLKDGGVLVAPVKETLVQIKKHSAQNLEKHEFPGFVFVPLVADAE